MIRFMHPHAGLTFGSIAAPTLFETAPVVRRPDRGKS
jgi:hypothetical protein